MKIEILPPDKGLQVLSIGGNKLVLLAQRAIWWPEQNLLAVADIHFGKAAAFRARGVPVPHGTTRSNLDALDALITVYGIRHVLFLGDFLHARAARAPATLQALQDWRDGYAQLALTLVRGNHDHHAGDPPASMNIDVVDEPFMIGDLAFCHHPQRVSGAYVLAGHIHPVIRLSAGRDALRLPCFVFGPEQAMLPAFGAFTGGHPVEAGPEDKVFICAEDKVFLHPHSR